MATQNRKTRMYEPWGYQEENNYESSENQFEIELNGLFASAKYDDSDKKIHFYNNDGEELISSSIDTTEFASSVIDNAYYDKTTKELVIKFSNGDEVRINMAEIIDENEFGVGLQVDSDGIVSVKVDESGDPYLTVGTDGIKLSGIKTAIDDETARATSAETALDEKLSKAISDETARAISAETELQENIDAEGFRAREVELDLRNKIDQEIDDRNADVDEEEARAKAAEAAANRRVDTLNDVLDAEKTIREACDVALGARIDQEIQDRKADVDEEEARAKAAENTLTDAINEEAERAISAETEINLSAFFMADYNASGKTINFYNKTLDLLSTIDATPFIKDGMIDRVYIDHETSELVIVWNTEASKQETRISLEEIFNPEEYYTKDDVDAKLAEKAELVHTHELADIPTIEEFGDTGVIVIKGTDTIDLVAGEF